MPEPVRIAPRGRLATFVRRTLVVPHRVGDQVGLQVGEGSYVRLPNGEVDLVLRVTPAGALVHILGTRRRAVTKTVENGVSEVIDDVARTLGMSYYDQSHLILDFQSLAGTTPSALVRSR